MNRMATDRSLQKDDVYRSIQAYFLHHLTLFKEEMLDMCEKNNQEIKNLKGMLGRGNGYNGAVGEDFQYSVMQYCTNSNEHQSEVKIFMENSKEVMDSLLEENKNLRKEVRNLNNKVTNLTEQIGMLKDVQNERFHSYQNELQNYLKVSMDSNLILRSLVSDLLSLKFDVLRNGKYNMDSGRGMVAVGYGQLDRNGDLAAGDEDTRQLRDMEEIVETVAKVLQVDLPLSNDNFAVNCKPRSITIQFQDREMLDDWLKAAKRRRERQESIIYQQLIALEEENVIYNKEPFDCVICTVRCARGEGIVLRDCLHRFCKQCMIHTVQYSEDEEVKCPYYGENGDNCQSSLQDREIKEIVPINVYESHLARTLSLAENRIKNSFHCKTPDCCGWCIIDDIVNFFECPVCRADNCVPCKAIHANMNCKQYQEELVILSETDPAARRTLQYLKRQKEEKNAMACPTCGITVVKVDGCSWCSCAMCKTEICWATMGPRWGPAGKGDISGGCRCNVNGQRCSPNCYNCH